MLRIPAASSATEAADYYVHLADADHAVGYYVDGQEMPGHWRGEAAARLGLSGGVTREAFKQLCNNINPATGDRLTARNRAGRRVGWDMNFHCPKTVSVVREMTGDTRIDRAFQLSVQETMEELERDCECRVRDHGQNGSRVTGNMVWGEFIHKTARPVDGIPDPHLHAHCFVFNATFDQCLPQSATSPQEGANSVQTPRKVLDRSRSSAAQTARLNGASPRSARPEEYDKEDSMSVSALSTPHRGGKEAGAGGNSQGQWKAADIANIKRDGSYFEAAFHARFAGRMAELGYGIRRTSKGWEIAKIPESVIEKFSRRTQEIERLADELGITNAVEKGKLGATSRKRKDHKLGMDALRQEWDSRLTAEERDAILHACDGGGTSGIRAENALDHSIWKSFERRSAVPERELVAEGLRRGVGSVAPDQMWAHTKAQQGRGTIVTGVVDGRRIVSTQEVLGEERRMIQFARGGRGWCAPLGHANYTFKNALFSDPSKDTSEQEKAIRALLGSRDRVVAVRGAAGTGKTTLMKEVVGGVEEAGTLMIKEVLGASHDAGRRVYAFAPTAEASRGVLRDEGFAGADTVARLLQDERLQREVAGQVLWVDEAGLLGARSMGRLFEVASTHGCRVILTGDTKQHAPVERGDALRILEEHGGLKPISITKIQRQRVHQGKEPGTIKAYRNAVQSLSEGDFTQGYDALDTMGAITELDGALDKDAQHATIADDYLKAIGTRNLRGKHNSVLVVSPTHAEGRAVTGHIREKLRTAGRLGDDGALSRLINLSWAEADRADPVQYRPGHVVQFHQNVAGGFVRGSRWTVVDGREKGTVLVESDDGTRKALPLKAAARFSVYATQVLPVAEGDRIRITQNGYTADRKHRLNNGALYSVKGFNEAGNMVLNNGWEVDKDYGHFAHGYVTTSHASQGKTVDVVLIAQSAESFAASSAEQFYVSVSRGREQVRIYTDDKEALKKAVSRSARRLSATELAGQTEPDCSQGEAKPQPRSRLIGNRVLDDTERARRRRHASVVRRHTTWKHRQQEMQHGMDIER